MNLYLRFSRIAPKFGLSVASCFFFPIIALAQANPQPHPRDAAPEPILKSAVPLDPAALLCQARAKILESTAKLSKYTCVQSVRRSRFEPPARIRGNPCNRLGP